MTRHARIAAVAGTCAWLGALIGWAHHGAGVGCVAVAAAVALLGDHRVRTGTGVVVTAVVLAAAMSGALAAGRHDATLGAQLPEGRVEVAGIVADEPVLRHGAWWVVLRSARVPGEQRIAPIGVVWPALPLPAPGDWIRATGYLGAGPTTIRGDPIAGRMSAAEAVIVRSAPGLIHRAAHVVRSRVGAVLGAGSQADALLAGFLIGDTSQLDDRRTDELRAAGLSHFVAVSGSNVALFLAAWWLVVAPLAGPRVRAAVGLIGLVLFVVITRWEPSVLRAATMLGLVLTGRLMGMPIDPVVALGWGVAGLMILSGDLAAGVGFQLSVAATLGVMGGSRLVAGRRPRWIWSVLGATGGAQAAVAPIVLYHFGSLPLMAPVANLLAAPLVTVATTAAGIAVAVNGGPALEVARLAAGGVLAVAEVGARWPQLDPPGLVVVAGLAIAARRPRWRSLVASATAIAVVLALAPVQPMPGATLTVLDVGQGDAIVVRDRGRVMLVDGGRDPQVLTAGLHRHRIDRVDVVVVTHGDADHAGGLIGLIDHFAVGAVWIPAFGESGELVARLVDDASAAGIPVERISAGVSTGLGRLQVTALGPARRYKSDNDGAIVLWVEAGATTVLLPSDVEAVAQADLPPIRPGVMLAPHHGSATTDLDWLTATVGDLAIVSVGPNRYGHPNDAVLAVLQRAGAEVLSTMDAGDVVVPLLP